jgi:hypothetical protein
MMLWLCEQLGATEAELQHARGAAMAAPTKAAQAGAFRQAIPWPRVERLLVLKTGQRTGVSAGTIKTPQKLRGFYRQPFSGELYHGSVQCGLACAPPQRHSERAKGTVVLDAHPPRAAALARWALREAGGAARGAVVSPPFSDGLRAGSAHRESTAGGA